MSIFHPVNEVKNHGSVMFIELSSLKLRSKKRGAMILSEGINNYIAKQISSIVSYVNFRKREGVTATVQIVNVLDIAHEH